MAYLSTVEPIGIPANVLGPFIPGMLTSRAFALRPFGKQFPRTDRSGGGGSSGSTERTHHSSIPGVLPTSPDIRPPHSLGDTPNDRPDVGAIEEGTIELTSVSSMNPSTNVTEPRYATDRHDRTDPGPPTPVPERPTPGHRLPAVVPVGEAVCSGTATPRTVAGAPDVRRWDA
jgi:hypothetical protein